MGKSIKKVVKIATSSVKAAVDNVKNPIKATKEILKDPSKSLLRTSGLSVITDAKKEKAEAQEAKLDAQTQQVQQASQEAADQANNREHRNLADASGLFAEDGGDEGSGILTSEEGEELDRKRIQRTSVLGA